MKRQLNIFLSLIFLFGVSHNSVAQSATSASATGHITAEVISIFSASETTQMNFGRFAPGSQGGEILLTPESTISVLGSIFVGTGVHNAASFYVTGEMNATFSISLPSGPVLLNHTTSAKTMRVEDWVSSPSAGVGSGILQNGFQSVLVGATLKVGTLFDNPVGSYAGTYTITFDFN